MIHTQVDATPHGLLEIFGKNLTYKGGNNVEQ